MKKLVSLFLALVLCLGLCIPALAADFYDVPTDHAFYDAISYCAERGIVGGYTDGTFQPVKTVTRSNFTVMLSRAFYADEVTRSQTEANLAYGTFYPNFKVMLMYSILDNTSFSTWDDIRSASVMNKGINRYDMAQLMTDIMSSKGFAASSADKDDAISKIADYGQVPSQYKDAVANVYALGIIGGYSDGTFRGEVTMTRGQAAVVIYRLAQYVGADPGTASEIPVSNDLTDVPNSSNNTLADQSPSTNAENEALTLRDGSAVTDANVLKIINEIRQAYPAGTTWNGTTYRDSSATIGGRKIGSVSGACTKVSNAYTANVDGQTGRMSTTAGCSGFAFLGSDAIFGASGLGGDNFPSRKLNSVADVRPGDIVITLNASGQCTHVVIAASSVKSSKTMNGVTVYNIDECSGNTNGKVVYDTTYIFDTAYNSSGVYFEAWTRYPA